MIELQVRLFGFGIFQDLSLLSKRNIFFRKQRIRVTMQYFSYNIFIFRVNF